MTWRKGSEITQPGWYWVWEMDSPALPVIAIVYDNRPGADVAELLYDTPRVRLHPESPVAIRWRVADSPRKLFAGPLELPEPPK
jgi:hypothetical protein